MNDLFSKPHTRTNLLTGEKVLVSPQRTQRPWQGKVEDDLLENKQDYDEKCYLCPTNKRANGEINPNYKHTFVFDNDYAALLPDTKAESNNNGLLKANSERGICKVICFSPKHNLTLANMSINEIENVIETWKTEFQKLAEIPFINSVQIFENKGEIMGCSNPHPHGQIWAQETIPNEIVKKTTNFEKYYQENKKSLLEDYTFQEIEEDHRIVYKNDDFVVLVPFWAVWPYETMIIPLQKQQNILSLTESMVSNYAKAIKTITAIYDKLFDTSFPYSAGIHQAPTDNNNYEYWHWHMSFYPPLLRSSKIKKFMVGYEMFAMPQRDITPEAAAENLKLILKLNLVD